MDTIFSFISAHASHAHWFLLIAVLLAGINAPVSIDVVMVIGAILAATVVPEKMWTIFIFLTLGCYFSAWIAYWVGRLLGKYLLRIPFFAKLLPEERLARTKQFYEKHGMLTLLIGRFIPFGVRNCLFMTTGMSKLSFGRFILRDAIACPLWASVAFYTFYSLGQNYKVLYHYVKTFNLVIFAFFAVAAFTFLWYKRRKMKRAKHAKHL